MYLERKQDLSIYYWLQSLFTDVPGLTFADGYPENGLVIPTISIDASTIDTVPWELGNKKRMQFRVWFIDVYARNKSQRDEFSYRILNALDDPIPVYNYDEGFPPDVTPTKLGALKSEKIRLQVVRILPELVDTLYYRTQISFEATYTVF